MDDKITDKFELYDILGTLVPGLVAVGLIYATIAWTGHKVDIPAMPEALQVLILSAVAVVLGQLVQSVGSLIEGFYFWTWGGRPSDVALRGKGKRITGSQSTVLKARLSKHLSGGVERDSEDHEVFLHALSVCNHKSLGRVAKFNSLYAYHRALTTLLLISTVATMVIIFFAEPNPPAAWRVLIGETAATLLFWYRTKQRGMYFADEVLRMADLEIAQRNTSE
jgi:hypothetical protein